MLQSGMMGAWHGDAGLWENTEETDSAGLQVGRASRRRQHPAET